jgi:hypothetical protein
MAAGPWDKRFQVSFIYDARWMNTVPALAIADAEPQKWPDSSEHHLRLCRLLEKRSTVTVQIRQSKEGPDSKGQ